MMKTKTIIWQIFIIGFLLNGFLLPVFAISDQITDLEGQYQDSRIKIDELNKQQAQQQQALADITERINLEKSKSNPDQNRLKNYMSQALDWSNKIDQLTGQINQLNNEHELLKEKLIASYDQLIVSLKQQIKMEKNKKQKQQLNQEVERLIEKKMQILPMMPDLQFDPAVINQIQANQSVDTLDALMYLDYLNNALVNIESYLTYVERIRHDVQDMQKLRQRTERFLDEVGDNGNTGLFAYAEASQTSEAYNGVDGAVDPVRESNDMQLYFSSYQSLTMLYQQLTNNSLQNSPITSNLPADRKGLNPESYMNFLEQVIVRLQSYQSMITKKIEALE